MKLPIDIVPNTCPVRFKWRQRVEVPVDMGAPEDVRTVEVQQPIPAMLEQPVAELISTCKKLQAFKDWVHAYLDSRGVPEAPEGVHGKAGCRIGDRMDWVWAELDRLRDEVKGGATANVEAESDKPARGTQLKRAR